MLRPILNNPDEFPSDPVLARQFGRAKPAWDAFMDLLKADYPLIAPEWRYYNDGKSWLCKVTRKAKTVCWVSPWDRFFKICFYFTAKAAVAIAASSLDPELKYAFQHPKGKCSLRSVITEVRKKSDLKPIKELIEIKLKMK